MLSSSPSPSQSPRSRYSLVLAAIACNILATIALFSASDMVRAGSAPLETDSDLPPIVSVNLRASGTCWNGHRMTDTQLPHRAEVATRFNTTAPVIVTAGHNADDGHANRIVATLKQAGLRKVRLQHIDTTSLTGHPADAPETILDFYRHTRIPVYPVKALKARHQGSVILDVHFDADGSVLDAVVQPSYAAPERMESALTAVLSWRRASGESSWDRIPVSYELRTSG